MRALSFLFVLGLLAAPRGAAAADPITVAILDFDTSQAQGLEEASGALLADLLSAKLSELDTVRLVERRMLHQILSEQALDISGLVDVGTAARVSQLVGAKVLVTGRAFTVSKQLMVTARLIGTETGRVQAVVAEGVVGENLLGIASSLAEQIGTALVDRHAEFVAAPHVPVHVLKTLTQALKGQRLPNVALQFEEQMLGVESTGAVSAGVLTSLLLGVQAEVMEIGEAEFPALQDYLADEAASLPEGFQDVDVLIYGDASGEFGLRTGDFVSAKAYVYVTAVETATRKVLATGEVAQTAVDIAPESAAVKAIRAATEQVAATFVPAFVDAWNEAH